MILLVSLVQRYRRQRHLSALVRQVSDRCQGEVWDRVRDYVFRMNLAEARGYVRARAVGVVRQRAEAASTSREPLAQAVAHELVARATDRVVQAILSDLVAGSKVARRAAA